MYNTIKIYAIRMNGSVHDLPGHFLAAHRLNAPHLGSVELSARTNIALEHQFFHVGDDCLPGLGAGAQPAQDYIMELQQLAGLRDMGIKPTDEFEAKKKQLLGL